MSESKHKIGFKLPCGDCCMSIRIYIDRERINAIGIYPLDKGERRIDLNEEMDLEFNVAELEVRDIDEIALLMNEETFNRFCELWRMYHGK